MQVCCGEAPYGAQPWMADMCQYPWAGLSDKYRDTTCMTEAAFLCQRARERDAGARGAPDDGAGSRQEHPVVYGAGRADYGGHSRLHPADAPLRAWLAKDRCCAHTRGCPRVLWTQNWQQPQLGRWV